MPHETTIAESNIAPTLEESISFWAQRLDRLEAGLDGLVGTGQYPEWWTSEDLSPLHTIVPQLEDAVAPAESISNYFKLFSKETAMRSAIDNREPYSSPLSQTIYRLGDEVVARGFGAESSDGPLHKAMLTELESNGTASYGAVLTKELLVLKNVYGTDTLTQLIGISGDEYSDRIRAALLQPNPIKWVRFNEEVRDPEFKWADSQHAAHTWMTKAVEAATGMPAADASNYVFSASRRADSGNTFTIDVINKINSFGIDRIKQLSDFTGIHGLEAYTIEQLERMEALAVNQTEVAERLSGHDVTAVMINRFGDHNGVHEGVANEFDDANDRTLFFEITSMGDIYRHMSTLKNLGIHPSTLVLAAHSGPGQFMVSDIREKDKSLQHRDIATIAGRKLVRLANAGDDLDPSDYGYSMHGMKGLARLVDTYMQPSTAIDDDDRDFGRKKIIFSACHTGTEARMGDIDDSDGKVQIGVESVLSQLGNDLIASGIKTNVDLYGAPGGIQMHRSEFGVHYSGQPTSFDDAISVGRPHKSALRIRVDNGKLTEEEVHDIVLRKTA